MLHMKKDLLKCIKQTMRKDPKKQYNSQERDWEHNEELLVNRQNYLK